MSTPSKNHDSLIRAFDHGIAHSINILLGNIRLRTEVPETVLPSFATRHDAAGNFCATLRRLCAVAATAAVPREVACCHETFVRHLLAADRPASAAVTELVESPSTPQAVSEMQLVIWNVVRTAYMCRVVTIYTSKHQVSQQR